MTLGVQLQMVSLTAYPRTGCCTCALRHHHHNVEGVQVCSRLARALLVSATALPLWREIVRSRENRRDCRVSSMTRTPMWATVSRIDRNSALQLDGRYICRPGYCAGSRQRDATDYRLSPVAEVRESHGRARDPRLGDDRTDHADGRHRGYRAQYSAREGNHRHIAAVAGR